MQSSVILFSFLGTIIVGINIVYRKILIFHIRNPIHLIIYQTILNLLIVSSLLFIMLITNTLPNNNLHQEHLLLIIVSAILIFLGDLSLYRGLQNGNASVGGIILSSRVIVSIVLAILFLGEIFPSFIYFWIVLIMGGVLLTTWQKNLSFMKGIQTSGSIYFFTAILLWGISNIIIGAMNNEVFILTFLFIRLFTTLILLILSYSRLNYYVADGEPIVFSSKYIGMIFIFVLLLTAGDILFIIALGMSVTISETIGTFQGVIAFILILFFSKNLNLRKILQEPLDKKTILVRTCGVLIATFATYLLIIDLSSLNL